MGLGLWGSWACSANEEFACLRDDQCAVERGGVCEQEYGYCSYPDSSCFESGRRFGDAAGRGFAGQCVPADGSSFDSTSDTGGGESSETTNPATTIGSATVVESTSTTSTQSTGTSGSSSTMGSSSVSTSSGSSTGEMGTSSGSTTEDEGDSSTGSAASAGEETTSTTNPTAVCESLDFSDGILDSFWLESTSPAIMEAEGELRFVLEPESEIPYLVLESLVPFDATESAVAIDVATIPPTAQPPQLLLGIGPSDNDGETLDDRISILTFRGAVYYRVDSDGETGSNVPIGTISASAPPWLRIRERGGTTYFERSADGEAWTVMRSIATPIDLAESHVHLLAGHYEPLETESSFALAALLHSCVFVE